MRSRRRSSTSSRSPAADRLPEPARRHTPGDGVAGAATLPGMTDSGELTGRTNRRIVLRQRPSGLLSEDDVEVESAPIPEPGDGEILVQVQWLGIDATVRTWLSRGEGYLPPVEIGEVVRC